MNNCRQRGITKKVFISPEYEHSINEYVTKEYVDLLFSLYHPDSSLFNNYYTKQEIYNKNEVDNLYNILENKSNSLYNILNSKSNIKIVANELPYKLENNTIYFVISDDNECKYYIYYNDLLHDLITDLSELDNFATTDYVDELMQLILNLTRHIFITLEDYDLLDTYEDNVLYLIVEGNNSFGDEFPLTFV